MKVILAGFPKTGTKTLTHAFRSLGYSVYDYEEHFWYHGYEWIRILSEGPSPGDFRAMYENIDVVSDVPASFFWEEISKEFPDAKIILMLRENEEVWFKSFWNQADKFKGFALTLLTLLSPTARRHFRFFDLVGMNIFGYPKINPWTGIKRMPVVQKLGYKTHNSFVLQNASRDRVLIYKVTEGWEPICKFLDIDVPDLPFPHRNIGGNLKEVFTETGPMQKRIGKEFLASATVIMGIAGFLAYKYII